MKSYTFILAMAAIMALTAGTALADSIKGKFGVTGRLGFSVPADSDINGVNVSTDPGFTGGGGFIYGITDAIATDIEINYSSYGATTLVAPPLFGKSDFETINISFGMQYRFVNVFSMKELVPYAGGGLDILLNDVSTGGASSVDNVVGVHICGGVDYFLSKNFALNAELRGVFAPDADINGPSGNKIGNFDPNNFSMTAGARYFFD